MANGGKKRKTLSVTAAALAAVLCAGLLAGCGQIGDLLPDISGNRISSIIDDITDGIAGNGESDTSKPENGSDGPGTGSSGSGGSSPMTLPGRDGGDTSAETDPAVPDILDGSELSEVVSRTLGMPYIGGEVFSESFALTDRENYRIEKTLAGANGWIAAVQRDFDGDRLPEICAVSIRGVTGENSLTFYMLEQSRGEWNIAAAFSDPDLNESLSGTEEPSRWDIFVHESDRVYIYIEHYGDEYHFADGTTWWLERLAYDEGSFDTVLFGSDHDLDLGFAGSDIIAWLDLDPSEAYSDLDASEISRYISAFQQAGLHVPNSLRFDLPIMNDEASAVPLARIIRYETSETWEDYMITGLFVETTMMDLTVPGVDLSVTNPFEEDGGGFDLSPASGAADGYIIPDSSTRLLTEADLAGLTTEELRIARNEIYARHGRIFRDQQLQAYFESQSWYHGTIPADEFSGSLLSSIEMANAVFIREEEERRAAQQ